MLPPPRLVRHARAGVAVGLAVAIATLIGPAAHAGQIRGQEWWLQALHVTHAWDSSRGSGVIVAVLDTGVAATQPDLAGSVMTGPDFTRSGRAPGTAYWGIHGTEVASLLAGHGHGPRHSNGIVGVAPAARILSVRVTLERGDPLLADPAAAARLPRAIARGIRYAVRHHAAVIDLPLDPVTVPGAAGAGGSPAERRAVGYALAHHVVLVAPAGDNGTGTDAVNYPAAYPGVISVGAVGTHFVRARFTSHRPYVTLTAAGVGVVAAEPSGYAQLSSTSAASAVVAGIAALIRARFPALTPAQVTTVLTRSTVYRRGGRRDGSGFGTVDAAQALAAAARMGGVAKTADSPAPPAQAAVRAAAAGRLLRNPAVDAGIAAAAVLAVLGAVGFARVLRRRRARSARLAEVRAAALVPPRKPARPALTAAGPAGFTPTPPAGRERAITGGPARAALPPGELAASGGTAARSAAAPLPARLPHASPMTAGASFLAATPASPAGPPDAGPPRPSGAAPAFPDSAFPGPAPEPSPPAPWAAATGPVPLTGGAARPPGPYRAGTVRRPQVSGSPPWEPAPRPESDLPWSAAPAPAAQPSALPQRHPHTDPAPSWDAIAEEVWPGGPRAAGRHPEAPHPPEPSPDGGPGGRRGYAWPPERGNHGRSGAPARETSGAPPWEINPPGGPPVAESRAGAARWEASARTWEGRTGTPDSSDVSTPDVAGMGTPRHADTGTAGPGGLPRRERRPAFQDAPAREQSASVWDSTDTLPSITPVDAATAYAAAPTPAEPPGAPEPDGGTEASGPLSSGDHSGRFRLSLPTDSTASFPLRKRTGEGGDG